MPTDNPAFIDDVCNGAAEIGEFIGEDERRAMRLCYTHQIPAWKEGGRWRMRKSRYLQHVADREDANLARAVLGGSGLIRNGRGRIETAAETRTTPAS